jgi:hypothetical protein
MYMKLLLFICFLLTSLNANAALNKWVDAEGKVHYSDSRPEDIKVQTLRSSVAPDSAASASSAYAPKTLAEREGEWKKSQKEKVEADKKAAIDQQNIAIKQKNCSGARSNLAVLENSQRMVTYNEKGEKSFLDESARQQQITEAQKAISSYCN